MTDPANRLVEDEQHLFEYDVNGNLVIKTEKASGRTWRYGYSVYDELISVSRHATAGAAPELTVAYAYDALGRRVSERKLDASGAVLSSKSFLHDGEHVAAEADTDASAAPIEPRRYTHTDNVDDLAAVTLAAGSGTVSPTAEATDENAPAASSYYVHADHQGSVRALTDDAGAVVNEYSYDSYGRPETSVEALPQPFRFTGREYDPDTGLSHYRSRAFDPETGRFLQEDPIWFEAGDLNVYRYVWNSPANWTDPSGMSTGFERAGLGAITAGLLAGLTLDQAIKLNLHLKVWNGTKYVVQEVTKTVDLTGRAFGCLLGIQLGNMAATIAGATDATVDVENCTVVWNTAGDDGDGPGAPPWEPPVAGPDDWPQGTKPAGEGWQWQGAAGSTPGGRDGGWVRPTPGGKRGKETLHDDRDHPKGKAPHIGWVDPDGGHWENYGDGWTPKR